MYNSHHSLVAKIQTDHVYAMYQHLRALKQKRDWRRNLETGSQCCRRNVDRNLRGWILCSCSKCDNENIDISTWRFHRSQCLLMRLSYYSTLCIVFSWKEFNHICDIKLNLFLRPEDTDSKNFKPILHITLLKIKNLIDWHHESQIRHQ